MTPCRPRRAGPGAGSPSRARDEETALQSRLARHWPESRRRQVSIVLALFAVFIATAIASSRLLRFIFNELDLVAYLGLFIACWIGAGGALVPVPGVRAVSWLMVIQQGAAMDPAIAALVAASAMALGQTSYFLVTRRAVKYRDDHRLPVATEGPAPPVDPMEPPVPDPTAEMREPAPAGKDEAKTGRMARTKDAVEARLRRHRVLTVFLVCLFPTPVTTVTTTVSATLRTPYPVWLAAAFSGYLVFCVVLAFLGQGLLSVVKSVVPS